LRWTALEVGRIRVWSRSTSNASASLHGLAFLLSGAERCILHAFVLRLTVSANLGEIQLPVRQKRRDSLEATPP